MRAAKNAWFTSKAEEVQRSRFGGKKVWKCIRDMQYGRHELVPSRLACPWLAPQPADVSLVSVWLVGSLLH